MKKFIKRLISKLKDFKYRNLYSKKINLLIDKLNKENKKIIIFPYVVDWDIPLFQRPQHIAKCFAEREFIYLFFTSNRYDSIKGYEEKEKNLFVINKEFENKIINQIKLNNKYIHLYSTDMKTSNKNIDEFKNKNFNIFYEYIDEISDELYGSNIPQHAREKHKRILLDKEIKIICTARKLYEEVINIRGNNSVDLITNGVDVEHFRNNKDINNKDLDKKVIGYFGAIASWFDFELIKKLAVERPEYEIVLIGSIYTNDISLKIFEEINNIKYVGNIDYKILPQYANIFDVSIIPFEINEITESTSPIKLFEYMALGKPIVTTDLPECRYYESVNIGKNYEEFIKKIDFAINLKNNIDYLSCLEKEAEENRWIKKADSIIKLISS